MAYTAHIFPEISGDHLQISTDYPAKQFRALERAPLSFCDDVGHKVLVLVYGQALGVATRKSLERMVEGLTR